MDNYQNNTPPGWENTGGSNEQPRVLRPRQNGFITAAMITGVLALLMSFTMTIYPSIVLGSLSIIFALLSKGDDRKMQLTSKIGASTGFLGLAISVVMLAVSLYMIIAIPEYREDFTQQFNQMYEQIYGESFEDSLKSLEEMQ